MFRVLTKGVAGPPAAQNGLTVNPVMAVSGEVGVPGNVGHWELSSSEAVSTLTSGLKYQCTVVRH